MYQYIVHNINKKKRNLEYRYIPFHIFTNSFVSQIISMHGFESYIYKIGALCAYRCEKYLVQFRMRVGKKFIISLT